LMMSVAHRPVVSQSQYKPQTTGHRHLNPQSTTTDLSYRSWLMAGTGTEACVIL
jgi:hypothetical protein